MSAARRRPSGIWLRSGVLRGLAHVGSWAALCRVDGHGLAAVSPPVTGSCRSVSPAGLDFGVMQHPARLGASGPIPAMGLGFMDWGGLPGPSQWGIRPSRPWPQLQG